MMDTQTGLRTSLLDAARAELVEHGRSAISLRAVARRAGVSHAAPKHHFGDRSGLLTAVAAEGFALLAAKLATASTGDRARRLGDLGRAYIDFSHEHPALFDLMFRSSELRPADPALVEAQGEAFGMLQSAVDGGESLSLISWALVHGLAVLAGDGALRAATGASSADAAVDSALRLAGEFADLATTASSSAPRPRVAPLDQSPPQG